MEAIFTVAVFMGGIWLITLFLLLIAVNNRQASLNELTQVMAIQTSLAFMGILVAVAETP